MTRRFFLKSTGLSALLAGCGSVPGELFGVRKPTPEFRGLVFNREASAVTFYVNRGEFTVPRFEVYRVDSEGNRRYLNFTWQRFGAQGTNGVAIYVMSHDNDEAIDFTSVYYVGVQVDAPVYATGGGLTTASAAALYRCDPSGTIARVSRQQEAEWSRSKKPATTKSS